MPDSYIDNRASDAARDGAAAQDAELDEEVYTALRAAGASPEEASVCLARPAQE